MGRPRGELTARSCACPTPPPRAAAHRASAVQLDRVISSAPAEKKLYCLGHVGGERAVLKLERGGLPAGADALRSTLLCPASTLSRTFENDVYSKYAASPAAESGALTVDLICPASDKHVSKYTHHPMVMVEETPAGYASVTQPFINSIPSSRIKWVYNILDKSAEAERMVFEDPDESTGFVLQPDLKWDGSAGALYCLAIAHRKDVRSLRDLRAEHLPMLRNLLNGGTRAIEAKYGVPRHKLRVFVHYQPSYYHFHVHYAHVEATAGGQAVGKAHLLADVIGNIELVPNYYERATLSYTLSEGDPLYEAWMKAAEDGVQEAKRLRAE